MIGAATAEARVLGAMMMQSLVVLLTITCLIAVTIAAIDLVWQRFDHARQLRMSYQDLREEAKQSEGDPHMKAQRRSRAEAIATNRMLLDVPKADVVIVNPTHFAVALKWIARQGHGARSASPRARARWRCASARSPRPPASRSTATRRPRGRCIATVEIGREIAPEHYRAVAAAIRFADRMRHAARAAGRGRDARPSCASWPRLAEARKARDLARLERLLSRGPRAWPRRSPGSPGRLTRDLADGVALPPAQQALRQAWADQRIRAAEPAPGRARRRDPRPRAPRRCRASASTAPSSTSSSAPTAPPSGRAPPAPSARRPSPRASGPDTPEAISLSARNYDIRVKHLRRTPGERGRTA